MYPKRFLVRVVILIAIVSGIFVGYQVCVTNIAHTTFDRYYRFRGCVSLVRKTDSYGDCVLSNGQTIRMVSIKDKWYLESDGPGIW